MCKAIVIYKRSRRISLVLLTDVNDCETNPCMNGATCQDHVGGYICECADGYTGSMCGTGMATIPVIYLYSFTCSSCGITHRANTKDASVARSQRTSLFDLLKLISPATRIFGIKFHLLVSEFLKIYTEVYISYHATVCIVAIYFILSGFYSPPCVFYM